MNIELKVITLIRRAGYLVVKLEQVDGGAEVWTPITFATTLNEARKLAHDIKVNTINSYVLKGVSNE